MSKDQGNLGFSVHDPFKMNHCHDGSLCLCRSCGRSPSIWSRWPSCRSSSWSLRRARPSPSPHTTCSFWACTARCTSLTGCGAITRRDSSTRSQWCPVSSRPSSTAISSICTSPEVSRHLTTLSLYPFSWNDLMIYWSMLFCLSISIYLSAVLRGSGKMSLPMPVWFVGSGPAPALGHTQSWHHHRPPL